MPVKKIRNVYTLEEQSKQFWPRLDKYNFCFYIMLLWKQEVFSSLLQTVTSATSTWTNINYAYAFGQANSNWWSIHLCHMREDESTSLLWKVRADHLKGNSPHNSILLMFSSDFSVLFIYLFILTAQGFL